MQLLQSFELSCLLELGHLPRRDCYFDKRSDFEKSKYYNDDTLENTCRKTFFFLILFLGKEFGGCVRRYGYKYPADYCPPGLSTWNYLRNLTWLSSCSVVLREQRFFYGEVGGE